MAKPARKKEVKSDDGEEPDIAKRSRSARKLLMAALLLSAASLGGGFFLARMAYQQDAAAYEPDYVDGEAPVEGEAPKDAMAAEEGGGKAEMAAGGEGEGKGKGEKKGEGDGKDEVEGMLAFNDILTNINGFDAEGRPTRAFVKLSLVLVYRPEEGAKELIKERQPFMRDLFNGYVRGLNEADMRGTVGLLNVKSELLKRARAAVGNDLPQEILISDLIVQ